MTLRIRALGQKILIKPDPIEEVTPSGIILSMDKPLERAGQSCGIIVSIGNDAWAEFEAPWAKIGDRVHYSRYAGRYIADPETKEEYMVMMDVDLQAIIEEIPSGSSSN